LAQGDVETAHAHFNEAFDFLTEAGHPWRTTISLLDRAKIIQLKGDDKEARRILLDAWQKARDIMGGEQMPMLGAILLQLAPFIVDDLGATTLFTYLATMESPVRLGMQGLFTHELRHNEFGQTQEWLAKQMSATALTQALENTKSLKLREILKTVSAIATAKK
jgi:hypothetical protein